VESGESGASEANVQMHRAEHSKLSIVNWFINWRIQNCFHI